MDTKCLRLVVPGDGRKWFASFVMGTNSQGIATAILPEASLGA